MNYFQRIRKIIAGMLFIFAGIILILFAEYGYMFILLALGLYLLVYGIRMMLYYFTMARLMVGGKTILYKGIILLDLAMFTLSLSSLRPTYLILYLVGIYAAYGVIDILRSFEAKKIESPEWKFKFISGLLNLLVAISAVVFGLVMRSSDIPVYIYCVGLIWSGVSRIISAFRRTAVVYIQ